MAYTTTELITGSYYLSGIVARDLQTVSGSQISDGLNLLNDLIAMKTAESKLIPYFEETDFNLIQGQETYFFANLLEIETFTFNIGPVRYQTNKQSRKVFQGTARVDNIDSLPYNWHFERGTGGGTLWLYFLPQAAYPAKLWGKYSLSQVALGQDLSLTLDRFYITYLRYALAEYMCSDYNMVFNPQANEQLNAMEAIITYISPPDMSVTTTTMFSFEPQFNYGDVNLGRGWRLPR